MAGTRAGGSAMMMAKAGFSVKNGIGLRFLAFLAWRGGKTKECVSLSSNREPGIVTSHVTLRVHEGESCA